MPDDDLDALTEALTQADADRAADLAAVEQMDEAQVEYLVRLSEMTDLETVGVEGRCI